MESKMDQDVMAGGEADTMMTHSMKMYFHTGSHAQILFQQWMSHSWQQMLGSCVGIFFIAMLYEGFKVGRELLQKKMTQNDAPQKQNDVYPVTTFNKGEGPPESYGSATSSRPLAPVASQSIVSRIFNLSHVIQAVLHIVQVWLSMCLMLIFMTYNVWLCLAVSLGAGAGYFAFAWLRSGPAQNDEHCN